MTRQFTQARQFDKKVHCFFCSCIAVDKNALIRVSTYITTKHLLHAVHISDNDGWKIRLCEILDPYHLKAIDVLYHKSCWLRHVYHTMRDNSIDERYQIFRAAAGVEIVEEIKKL